MTTTLDTAAIGTAAATRQEYFHDPQAPAASVVTPSVVVAVRWHEGRLLLVRRCDTGAWGLPGGRVDVGESAVDAAVRETAEQAGVQVVVTGLLGIFTDPGHVIRSPDGEVRQQFAVLFRARAVGGAPRGDLHETSEAAWVTVAELSRLPIPAAVRAWIAEALANDDTPLIA
jgi:8-oxo-dGTP diphosphatase